MSRSLLQAVRALSMLALVASSPVVAGCQRANTEMASVAPLAVLDAGQAPLRADFDRDAQAVRLVVLASPT